MRLNAKGQLGVGERCVEADTQGLKLVFCRLGTVDGPWQYDQVSNTEIYVILPFQSLYEFAQVHI